MVGCILVAVVSASVGPRIVETEYTRLRIEGGAVNVYRCDKRQELAEIRTRPSGGREWVAKNYFATRNNDKRK